MKFNIRKTYVCSIWQLTKSTFTFSSNEFRNENDLPSIRSIGAFYGLHRISGFRLWIKHVNAPVPVRKLKYPLGR